MYKISEFSEMTGLSKETLRYYEQEQLLEPAFVDPSNNYRYYDDGSIFLAVLLQKIRSFGCSIQEMKDVMRDESFENLEALLLMKKQSLQIEMSEKQQKIVDIEAFIRTGREELDE
ncbi:MerR family transcriptional regulator [Sporosarcina sp. E16_8]|uniref:MerR family transcriptional regulator n=1 Tax=Sporosarcina sp. E16_8 TaxID=2789295 RepID=UPI001A930A91|nr:MerR family transcriptional regulator [Sporosarcina sp. E16_8]MBO0589473.1 MerR family transcriptional regulator [Sporosarcina sp. E16_8]